MNFKTNVCILFTQDFEDIEAGTKVMADIVGETKITIDLELNGKRYNGIPDTSYSIRLKDLMRIRNQIALSN